MHACRSKYSAYFFYNCAFDLEYLEGYNSNMVWALSECWLNSNMVWVLSNMVWVLSNMVWVVSKWCGFLVNVGLIAIWCGFLVNVG